MEIYKHIKYNPQMRFIEGVIEEAQKDSDEWKFEHSQPITGYEWIAIFSRWVQEDPKALKLPNTKNLTLSPNKENKVEEIPQFKGTREALNNLSIKEN